MAPPVVMPPPVNPQTAVYAAPIAAPLTAAVPVTKEATSMTSAARTELISRRAPSPPPAQMQLPSAWSIAAGLALVATVVVVASHRSPRQDEDVQSGSQPSVAAAASIGLTPAPLAPRSVPAATAPAQAPAAPARTDAVPARSTNTPAAQRSSNTPAPPRSGNTPAPLRASVAPTASAVSAPSAARTPEPVDMRASAAAPSSGSEPARDSARASDAAAEAFFDAVSISGCLVRDDDGFVLKNTSGASAPKSRSWKSGFLKKRAASVELVDASGKLGLQRYVGRRVTATGALNDREMRARSVQSAGSSCD
jgi:ribonuclease E